MITDEDLLILEGRLFENLSAFYCVSPGRFETDMQGDDQYNSGYVKEAIHDAVNVWAKSHIDSRFSTERMHKIYPLIVGRTFCNYCRRDLTRTDERCIYCSGEPLCPMCKKTMEIIKDDVVKLSCHSCGVFFDGVDWYDNDLTKSNYFG